MLCYYRLSPDGRRVLFGGRPRFTHVAPETSARLLHALMLERFPQLAGVRITHGWMGNLAFAFDQLPHMGEIDGVHYALACNGSGVAMLGWLGKGRPSKRFWRLTPPRMRRALCWPSQPSIATPLPLHASA